MDGRLALIVLASLLSPCWTENSTCLKTASTCEECIKSGPDCGWCMDPKLPPLCNAVDTLQSGLCSNVYNPTGELRILRNERADGRSILLEPQVLSITLRPGKTQVFHLTMTSSSDQSEEGLELHTSTLPEAINITLRQISTANPAVFEVTLNIDKCPSQSQSQTGPWSVHINPKGSSEGTKVDISLECNCECLNKPEPNSPECDTHGTQVCGLCLCQEPYSGPDCRTNNNYCRPNPLAPVCNGRGNCYQNFCVCNKRKDVNEKYSGQFCECSNFDCPLFNGRLCGGRGKCECGECVCDEGWTGDTCLCPMDTAPCMADNQMICNGHGLCQCGVCTCDPPYMGPTCESCPTCENQCQKYKSCAECRVFSTGRCDGRCQQLTVNIVDSIEDITTTPLCKMISQSDSCFIHFSYSRSSSTRQLTVAKTKQCPRLMHQ